MPENVLELHEQHLYTIPVYNMTSYNEWLDDVIPQLLECNNHLDYHIMTSHDIKHCWVSPSDLAVLPVICQSTFIDGPHD